MTVHGKEIIKYPVTDEKKNYGRREILSTNDRRRAAGMVDRG